MHSWNPKLVEALYEKQTTGFLTRTASGHFHLQPPIVAKHYRAVLADKKAQGTPSDPDDEPQVLTQAVKLTKAELAARTKPGFPYNKPSFGYVVQWLSELGKTVELNDLLSYADHNLHPEWDDGGLYYRRNDSPYDLNEDDSIKWTFMSPYTGNAAIGYARLNVKDGQKLMYERPWSSDHLKRTPWIDNLDFVNPGTGVSVLRGEWDPQLNALVLTVKGWDYSGKGCDDSVTISPIARNLGPGLWGLYVDGELVSTKDLQSGDVFEVTLKVDRGDERDVVFLKA